MRKLFKKSIACVLAAILCVSLCVCAIPASAEAIQFSTNAVTAKAGDAVVIDFEIADFAAVKAAQIKLVLPEAIASIDSVSLNGDALVATEDVFEIGEGYVKLQALFGDSEYDDFAAADSLVLSIAATVADVEADTYAYGESVVNLYSETAALEVNGAFGAFTVVEDEPVVIDPELDPNLTITANAAIADTVALTYVVNGATDYADFYLEISGDRISATNGFNYDKQSVIFNKDAMLSAGSRYAVQYFGIAMYELNVPLTATVYAKNDDGVVVAYSNPYTATVKELVVALYNTTKSAETKTIVSDLLVLGTEAQKYFATAGSDLANIAYPDADFVGTPSADYGTLANTNSDPSATNVTTAINLDINPGIRYGFKNCADAENLKVVFTYFDRVNNKDVITEVTADDMTIVGGVAYVMYTDIAFYSGADTVTATVYDGDEVLYTHEYCLETVLAASVGTARIQSIVTAIAKFGKACQNYYF